MKKVLYSLGILAVLAIVVVGVSVLTPKSVDNVSKIDTTPKTLVPVTTVATVAIQSISHSVNTASVFSALSNTVTWGTTGYPTNAGVNINLIKKVANSPVKYTLVRQIASNVENSGQYTWVSNAGEVGTNLYVEVTCSDNTNLSEGCQVAASPLSIK